MERPADKVDRVSVLRKSQQSKDRVDGVLQDAENVKNDPKKRDRLEDSLCKCCYYLKSLAGAAAITTQPCGHCGESQMYANTCTDSLCIDCASKLELCKRCGGDLHMRVRRKSWPEGI